MARMTPLILKLQQPFEVKGFAPLLPNKAVRSGNPTWCPTISSTDWALSNNNFTANRTSLAASFYALLRANIGFDVGSFTTRIDATTASQTTIGFDTGVETAFLGSDAGGHSAGYRYDNGDVYFNNSLVTNVATSGAGDVILCAKNGAFILFYKQTAGTGPLTLLATVNCTGSPLAGFAYPTVSNGTAGGPGTQVSLTSIAAVSGTTWQLISSVAASWSETSLSFGRTRAFVGAAAQAWSEASALSRLRAFIASTAQAWSETAILARVRAVTSSTAAAFAETAALSRLRKFVSAAAMAFTETSSFAQFKLFAASAVSAAWVETSATVQRVRAFVTATAEAWSETSSPSRVRGFVSASGEIWVPSAALSRRRGFASTTQQTWVEGSALARLRGIGSQSAAQWAETSVVLRRRAIGASAAAAVWSELAAFGSNRGLLAPSLVSAKWAEASIITKSIGAIYPLAGIPQTYPLEGIPQQYPLAS